jgi:tetratricopeptide (TPR) repeat protein
MSADASRPVVLDQWVAGDSTWLPFQVTDPALFVIAVVPLVMVALSSRNAMTPRTTPPLGTVTVADAVAVQDVADAMAAFNAALAFAGARKLPDAELAFREAVRRDPRFHRAWYNLGLLLAQLADALASLHLTLLLLLKRVHGLSLCLGVALRQEVGNRR